MVDAIEKEEQLERIAADIADEIGSLAAQIKDNTQSTVLSGIIARLKNAQSSIPLQSRESASVNAAAESAVKKAEEIKSAEEAKDAQEALAVAAGAAAGAGLIAASAADIAFSQQMLQFMSPGEKQFYESLKGPQTLVLLNENGQAIRDKNGNIRTETVDGSLLQADFAHIKYHTLDKQEREKIGLPPDEGPDGKRLHEALHRLEGYHINRLMHDKEHPMTLEEAQKKIHNDFARAHEQVDSTLAMEDSAAQARLEVQRADPLQREAAKNKANVIGAAAKYHEDELSRSFDKILTNITGEDHSQHRHQQGVEVASATAQTHLGKTIRSSEPALS